MLIVCPRVSPGYSGIYFGLAQRLSLESPFFFSFMYLELNLIAVCFRGHLGFNKDNTLIFSYAQKKKTFKAHGTVYTLIFDVHSVKVE